MIVGENAREDDNEREHHQGKETDQHAVVLGDEAIRLIPPRDMTLEKAIEFIADDEYVEVTPKSIRLPRKSSTPRSVPSAGRKSAPAPKPRLLRKKAVSVSTSKARRSKPARFA